MPHKRAKRSTREAERKSRQSDLAPTPVSSEPIPKGMARVLGAERVQREYREQLKKKQQEERKGAGRGIELLPGESLREFNRRVEEVHRPLVRGALKRGQGDDKRKGKRKREEEEEEVVEEEVREFETVSSSAPKRLQQVALAPPVFTKGPRGSGVGKSGGKAPAVSMARKVMLEQERARAVEMYRALKASKSEAADPKHA